MIAVPLAAVLAILATLESPLSGEVVDEAGRPVPGAEVALAAGMTRPGTVPILATAVTDGSGRFHLPGVSSRRIERLAAPTDARGGSLMMFEEVSRDL